MSPKLQCTNLRSQGAFFNCQTHQKILFISQNIGQFESIVSSLFMGEWNLCSIVRVRVRHSGQFVRNKLTCISRELADLV